MQIKFLKPILSALLACICLAAKAVAPLDSTVVSIVDIYPGEDIYELEGHTVLRIQHPMLGSDMAISYGTFDFNAPNFAYRFVKGETDYWVSAIPWEALEYEYRRLNRRMVEHTLSLDSVQTERLLALLNENLKPANRTYRYNYVKDNCATRPVGIVEKALGDTIVFTLPAENAGLNTFRQVMRHYHRNYPWYQFGIDLALGSGIDYDITPREMTFAPVLLDAMLDSAYVAGHPLVASSDVIFEGADVTLPPTPWYLTPLFVCWLVFAAALAVTWHNLRSIYFSAISKLFDSVLFGICGLLGLLLTFLIFVSQHEATSPNWLYLWLNPLCFAVPILMWRRKATTLLFYHYLNLVLLAAMAVAFLVSGQGFNPAFLPLVLADAMRSIAYIYITERTEVDDNIPPILINR